MKDTIALIVASVAVVIAIAGFAKPINVVVQPAPSQSYGGSTSDTFTAAALISNGDITATDDVTVSGGTVSVSGTNTATSTIAAQCWQLTATSTAAPLKAVPAAISTTTTTFGNGTVGFPLVAVFGTCPNL